MTTCLGKSCPFGLLCVSCVGICQFVSVLLPFWFLGWEWDSIVLIPDHWFSFYFDDFTTVEL